MPSTPLSAPFAYRVREHQYAGGGQRLAQALMDQHKINLAETFKIETDQRLVAATARVFW
ncbi:hypothetical protein SAMD00023353_5700580 [Rosellinia necatrix]|uniref:Uncharacterized protein n=1 Tax=Rosellinia necatrix TaxID=77044 RepID=A0A1S8AA03_ROSNE|nr:hypothetical protein SAMD00023353_5700580 [Rosellinia necatrix]